MIARGVGVALVLCAATAAAQDPGAPPGAQPAPPPDPQLPSAGGLTAPPPIPEEKLPKKGETKEKLDASKEKDSGRGLSWFWIDVEGGFEHVGLETFAVDKSNLTAGIVPSTASGGFVGAGLGLQLVFFRIGPRGRIGFFKDWQLFSIGGEIGFRIPLGFLEPHIDLGGGYIALGNFNEGLSALSGATSIRGGYGRIGGGLDFYIGKVFSIGPAASWEFMGLTRPGVSLSDLTNPQATSLNDAQRQAAAAEGSGYGSAVSVGAQAGLSF